MVCCTPDEKQGIFDSRPIMLTRSTMLSADLRRAFDLLVMTSNMSDEAHLGRPVYKAPYSHRSQEN